MGFVGLYGAQWCHEAHPWFSSSHLGVMEKDGRWLARWDDGMTVLVGGCFWFWLVEFTICVKKQIN